MRKACRNRPLTEVQTKRPRLSKTRYVVEQLRYAAIWVPLCAVNLFRID